VRVTWLVWLSITAFQASAQIPVNPDLSEYPYLLRIQHGTANSNSCLLLQQTGAYHLERTSGDTVEVFEAVLPSQELLQVRQRLELEQLRNLAQSEIANPLLVLGRDKLQINIFRGNQWQDLFFPDAESQKPFAKLLVPLVDWFKSLPKAPYKKLTEDEGKNHCLAPEKVELKIRPPNPTSTANEHAPLPSAQDSALTSTSSAAAVPSSASIAAPTQSPFVFRFETDDLSLGARAQCVLVYPDGRYHLEKAWQQFHNQVVSQVYEGSVGATDLQTLQQLLDDPNLRRMEQPNLKDAQLLIRGGITNITISRGNQTQHLLFGDNIRAMNPNGKSVPLTGTDSGLIRPIESWVKTKILSAKTSPANGVVPTRCFPR